MKFITEDSFTKYTNITTKLKWKLFAKVFKRPSEEAWVGQTECLIKKRSASALIQIMFDLKRIMIINPKIVIIQKS